MTAKPMMFFYQREGTEEGKTLEDSFNVNRVLRTWDLGDGKLMVLLDDFHEQYQPVQVLENKKMVMRDRKVEVGSNIPLNAEDATRFRALFEMSLVTD